jgi:hypothetical protein
MGCKGCPEKNKNIQVDKYGNPVLPGQENQQNNTFKESKEALAEYEKEVYNQSLLKTKANITYKEYVNGKAEHRKKSKDLGDSILKSFSDDFKRIQVDELIAVVNNEEVHRLSPTQALVMLYELVHHKDYQKIISEFTNLNEQVDKKYQELMNNKIITSWNPK